MKGKALASVIYLFSVNVPPMYYVDFFKNFKHLIPSTCGVGTSQIPPHLS